jgi:hypothetical protein
MDHVLFIQDRDLKMFSHLKRWVLEEKRKKEERGNAPKVLISPE